MSLVHTQEQYVLVHEVILEMIKWGCTEIPVCELTNANTDFGLEGEGEGESVLEKLFKVRLINLDTLVPKIFGQKDFCLI